MTLSIEKSSSDELRREVARRRTFAIISHPDAGKTTLTEKLLLYSGAVHLAGAVQARSSQRQAKSDWMELEQARGISITSTMLQFDYQGARINLLDTPGHQDFSEDTYRTLMAVDSAVMVLDGAKGIEPQTKKLFAVCRKRGIPILTFINKMDQPGRHPFDLLDEIERTLGMTAVPFNWPIGEGSGFQGVYDFQNHHVLFFERTAHNQRRAPMTVDSFPNARLAETLGDAYRPLQEEIGLLKGAGTAFDRTRFLTGELTPVFFGSALTNFGVEPFLDAFAHMCPQPGPYMAGDVMVEPEDERFTGFIFKVQANMDPSHRDRIAFLRVCSGAYERGMKMQHVRIGKDVRVADAVTFLAGERSAAEEAVAGDIIGLHNHGTIQIGDTFTEGEALKFTGIPHFAPELFQRIRLRDPLKMKHLQKGLQQLSEEGSTQVFMPLRNNDLIVGAVGTLQFDVVAFRLRDEYKVDCLYEPINVYTARWVECDDPRKLDEFRHKAHDNLALDGGGHLTYLAPTRVNLGLTEERWPDIRFRATREH